MVSSIRPEAVRIARFARETMEPGILRIAVKSPGNQSPFSMGQAVEERELAAAQSGADHFLRADDRMHRALCRHAGRKTAWFAMSDARTHMDRAHRMSPQDADPSDLSEDPGRTPLRSSLAMSLQRAIS